MRISNRSTSSFAPYATAALVTAGAVIIVAAIKPWTGASFLIALVLPIIASAYLGGMKAGLLSTALVLVLAAFLLLEPTGSLQIGRPRDLTRWLILGAIGVLISLVAEAINRAHQRNAECLACEREEALRRKEAARYRHLLEVLPAAAYTCDAEGRVSFYNKRAVALWGREPQLGCDLWCGSVRLFNADGSNLPLERSPMAVALKTGSPSRGQEIVIERPDGSRTCVLAHPEPLRDAEGKLVGAINVLVDITERKSFENALALAHARFRCIVDSNVIGMAFIEPGGRVLQANGYYLELLGKSPQELESGNINWRAQTPPEYGALDEKAMLELQRAGTCTSYEKEYVRNDGTRVWVNLSHALLPGPERPIIVFALDITQRKHAEDAVRHERAFLRKVIDVTPSLIFLVDRSGRIVLANSALGRCYGASQQELTGKRCADFALDAGELAHFHNDDLEVIDSKREKVIPEEKVTQADGQVRWFSTIKVPWLNADGSCDKVLGVAMDITDRKKLELDLKEAARRKDEFLAMLGHELRNPLAPIRNAMFVLRNTRDERIISRAREMVDRQVTQMSKLIDDLLDVSRIARGRIQLHKQRLDLAAVVRSTAEDYCMELELQGLHCELAIPNEPLWVLGDATRLAQVLSNILHNAGKFTHAGGTIFVSLSRENGQALVRIRDTGVGIAPQVLAHVFEPFAQADQSLARSEGGLGLGLALVKGLIELHDGSVAAYSKGLGQGATFEFRLPRLNPPAEQNHASAPAAAGVAHRILVVDDSRDAAESLLLLLEGSGHTVEVAFCGVEALEKAQVFHPEIVLCDIGLPGELNGYDVARALRADPRLPRAFLVALTGYGQDEDQRRAREAGFDLHLTKPADPARLQQILAEQLTAPL